MNIESEKRLFVLTEDTKTIGRALLPEVPIDKLGIDTYLSAVSSVLTEALLDYCIDTKTFKEEIIDSALSARVQQLLDSDPDTICICLDRFLLSTIENNENYADRFARFSITRTSDGQKVPRIQSPSFEEQLQTFEQKFSEIPNRSFVIVDDGVFSGGTMLDVITTYLSKINIKKQQCTVVGFIGNSGQKTLEDQNIRTEILNAIPNLYDWIDLRDLGVFGGKLNSTNNTDTRFSSPYLYPWSDGKGASFDKFENFFDISSSLINAQIGLFLSWESMRSKEITFADLTNAGFPLPNDEKQTITISPDTRVVDYLKSCDTRIQQEKQRDVVVFDMDGTLYQLDGENNGYKGSLLEEKVLQNAQIYIQNLLNCNTDEAQKVLDVGLQDPVGLSAYLSAKYGVTRKQYFDAVWNIDPNGILQNFDIPVQTIKDIQKTDKKLVLLTSAPKIWQAQVTDYLGITEAFESIYTAEDFQTKKDIFGMLTKRYLPGNILSVGDQKKTDITPADELGCKTFLVASPRDLERISL